MARLSGMIALVTGASRGIGAAVARHMASEGATVVVNYRRSEAQALKLVEEIEASGGSAMACRADVTSQPEMRKMVETVRERFDRIDVLVCNAGIIRDGLTVGMSMEDWSQVVEVNLTGAFIAIREVLAEMVARRSGSIVCMASVHAESGGNGHCNYAASKAGLLALTRSLAIEVAPRGIRVNAVSPGLILTEMTQQICDAAGPELLRQIPMRRFGEPLEVARAVTFLASADASYITGTTLWVSGGLGL
jgi:3-oxoacyl-[acyl-carrier protein] reductase